VLPGQRLSVNSTIKALRLRVSSVLNRVVFLHFLIVKSWPPLRKILVILLALLARLATLLHWPVRVPLIMFLNIPGELPVKQLLL